MSRFRLLKSTIFTAVLLSVLPVSHAQAQVPAHGLTASGNFIGVMGEVKNAGVYEFVETAPPLVDVLRFAGGFTRFADQSVRIIRGGRSGLREFVTPSNDVTLLPGDVVIADSSQRLNRRNTSTATEINNLPSVEVAIVGLLDRPVITTVNGSQATMGGFLKYLGQAESLVSRVRLVESRMSSRKLLATTRLSDNCVVVIPNPRDVDRRGIPELPPSFARVSVASINNPVQYPGRLQPVPPPQPRPMHPMPYPPVAPYPRLPLSASAIPTLIQPPANEDDDSNSPPGRAGVTDSVPGEAFVEEFNGGDPNRVYQPVPSQLQPNRFPMPFAANPQPAVENLHPPVTSPSPTIEQADAEAGSGPSLENIVAKTEAVLPPAQQPPKTIEPQIIPSKESDSDVAMIVLYLAMVGLLVIGILLLAMVRTEPPAKKPQVEVAPKTASEADLLDRLIRNELPILEEPCDLPTKLEFFGQTRSDRKLRIDQAHSSPAKPHFDRRDTVPHAVPPRAPHFQRRRSAKAAVAESKKQPIQQDTSASTSSTSTDELNVDSDSRTDTTPAADKANYERWLAEYRQSARGENAEQLEQLDHRLPRSSSSAAEQEVAVEVQKQDEPPVETENTASTVNTTEDVASDTLASEDAVADNREDDSLLMAKTLASRSSDKRRNGRRLRIDSRHHHNGPRPSARPETQSAVVSESLLAGDSQADDTWLNEANETSFELNDQESFVATDDEVDEGLVGSAEDLETSADSEPVDQPVWVDEADTQDAGDQDRESETTSNSTAETSVLDRVLMSVHGR